MTTGLILFAHGARDPRWAEPFERLRHKVATARPGLPVTLAYLELMTPNLASACDSLIGQGCTAIRIVPVFFGQGGHVRNDLPALTAEIHARHPTIAFELATAVGDHDTVLQVIAEVCIQNLGL